jgi:hypothetical protein
MPSYAVRAPPCSNQTVMATDIADKELQALRKNRWNVAFADSTSTEGKNTSQVDDQKASIVIEQ